MGADHTLKICDTRVQFWCHDWIRPLFGAAFLLECPKRHASTGISRRYKMRERCDVSIAYSDHDIAHHWVRPGPLTISVCLHRCGHIVDTLAGEPWHLLLPMQIGQVAGGASQLFGQFLTTRC